MRTRNGNQDPTIERHLAAIDATLGGQPVDADLTELADLVLVLRDERPQPRPAFMEELDDRLATGFPQVEVDEGAKTASKPRFWSGIKARRLPLAFGSAAALLIVVTAVVSSGVLSSSDEGRQSVPAGGAAGKAASPATAPKPELAMPSAAAQTDSAASPSESRSPSRGLSRSQVLPAPAGGGVRPDVRTRLQDRDAALVLATPRKDVEDAADGVIEVTDRYEGFVLRSNVSGGDQGRAGATLELRVPSDKLQPALRDLSELAHVRSRTQTTQDITARFVSARSRLSEAVAERRALLRQLAKATTANETASIRARLRLANRRIAAVRSDLRSLRNLVNFSTVSVSIEADESVEASGGKWTPGDALRDARDILRTTLGILLVSLAVLLPLTALAVVAWFATRAVRRGYRERALDRN